MGASSRAGYTEGSRASGESRHDREARGRLGCAQSPLRLSLLSVMATPTSSPPVHAAAPDRRLALRVVTMPRDTNHYGTIFGGVILSYIDQAGYVEARRHADEGDTPDGQGRRWVTVALDRVEFKQPVHLGDIVTLYTTTTRVGTTSVTIRVEVEADRFVGGQVVPVTEAQITLVSVGSDGRPTPIRG